MLYTECPGIGHNSTPTSEDNSSGSMEFSDVVVQLDECIRAIDDGVELSPAEIGKLQGLARWRAINCSLAVAFARLARSNLGESPLMCALAYFVAVHSDNEHGRCTHGATRIAAYLGCEEGTVRRTIRKAVAKGGLRIQTRAGKPPALWLPYVAAVRSVSAFEVIGAIAPPSRVQGRPPKVAPVSAASSPVEMSEPTKTPSTMRPDICFERGAITPGASRSGFPIADDKPRASTRKTPGVRMENPGHVAPDSSSSTNFSPLNNLSEVSSSSSEGRKAGPTPTGQWFDAFPNFDTSSHGNDPVPGVDIGTVMREILAEGSARVSASIFLDAVRAAQQRGVHPCQIGSAIRKSIARTCERAGDREPTSSELLRTAVSFVERSDGETISKPLEPRSNGAPKALNVNRDFTVPSFSDLPSIDSGPYEG